jgi:hypothetical protein
VNAAIDSDLADELSTFAFHHRRSIADVIQQAVWQFLEKNWRAADVPRDPSVPTAPIPREHRLIFDDEDDDWAGVVEIYQRATGNLFKDGDREILALVREYGKKAVTLGILLGRSRNPKKIGSFKYFYNPILEAAAMQPSKIEEQLTYYWQMFTKRY